MDAQGGGSGQLQVIIEYMLDTCKNEGMGREAVSEGLLLIHSYRVLTKVRYRGAVLRYSSHTGCNKVDAVYYNEPGSTRANTCYSWRRK